MTFYAERLPDFPWDLLTPIRERAAEYPQGAIDLTVGSPIDAVPSFIQDALVQASDAFSYPPVVGTPELRAAITNFCVRERGCSADIDILPAIGSKEMIGLLPSFLGLGAGDTIAFPDIAYPTYDIGARLAGCESVCIDPMSDPASWGEGIALLWLNSPSNPDGRVLDVEQLRRIRAWARDTGTIIASDECYTALCWDVDEAPSILDVRVCGDDASGLVTVYSLSKQSNLAGYRASFVAGDAELIEKIRETRKHLGFMMPAPVQNAMAVALADEEHVRTQREIYARRREVLLAGVERSGLINSVSSVGGLYLWVRAPEEMNVSGWDIVRGCAELGIIVTPGDFYGEAGRDYVRMSLTAPDDAIAHAAERLSQLFNLL